MREIRKEVNRSSYDTNSWRLYTEGLTTVVFDIETTGLSSSRDALILGGSLAPEYGSPAPKCGGQAVPAKRCVLRQYLAGTPKEEKELLERYLSDLSSADIWISYNGDTFDRPFLAQRLFKNGICEKLPLHQSIDLYRLFRRYSPLAKLLPDLRQTTVETALGLADNRTDAITGKESIALYRDYVRTCDPVLEETILLHNHDDLLMLHQLMSMLDKMDLHRIMFQRGFLTGLGDRRILAEKLTLGKNFLRVEGHTRGISGDYDVYSDVYSWSHRQEDRSFTLTVPCIYERNATFIDTEAFDVDFTPLSDYPAFINGYLLFHDGQTAFCREVNHTLKLLLTEILKKI